MRNELKENLDEAKKVIKKGGLVVFPTETAYGIATDATDRDAVDRVFESKQRPQDKGLTVIVDSLETAEEYARLSDKERKIVDEFMPGPLTLVAEKKNSVPDNLNSEFAFRISSGQVASKLSEAGIITATSANVSGEDTAYSVNDISDELLDKVDYVLDAGELEEGPTSTIVEVSEEDLIVHREGPIKKEEIEKVM